MKLNEDEDYWSCSSHGGNGLFIGCGILVENLKERRSWVTTQSSLVILTFESLLVTCNNRFKV